MTAMGTGSRYLPMKPKRGFGKVAQRVLYIQFAIRGLSTIYREELNIRILTIFSAALLLTAQLYAFSEMKFLAILCLSVIMLALEMLNSAIERICNMTHPEWHPEIKRIKDIASAAVFMPGILMTILWLCWI